MTTTVTDTAADRRFPRADVEPLVREVVALLAPDWRGHVKVRVAGSLRRGKETVHDCELVILPRYDENLLGETEATSSALDAAIVHCINAGLLAWDTEVKRNGPAYKRFIAPSLDGMPFELFLAKPDNWGNVLAIRTGPARGWNDVLLNPRKWGGLLPDNLVHAGGYLWRFSGWWQAQQARSSGKAEHGQRLVSPDEAAFFAHLGLPCLPPQERDEAGIARLREIAERGGKR